MLPKSVQRLMGSVHRPEYGSNARLKRHFLTDVLTANGREPRTSKAVPPKAFGVRGEQPWGKPGTLWCLGSARLAFIRAHSRFNLPLRPESRNGREKTQKAQEKLRKTRYCAKLG